MKKAGLVLITLAGLVAGPAQSAEQDFVGNWMIELTQRNRIQNGLLGSNPAMTDWWPMSKAAQFAFISTAITLRWV